MQREPALKALRLVTLSASVLSGCASSGTVNYKETMPAQLAPKSFEDVMVTYVAPAKSFQQVGLLTTSGFDHPDEAQLAIRQNAAALGFDGLAHVHCGSGTLSNPFWGPLTTALVNMNRNGDCAAMAFIWSRK